MDNFEAAADVALDPAKGAERRPSLPANVKSIEDKKDNRFLSTREAMSGLGLIRVDPAPPDDGVSKFKRIEYHGPF